MRACFNSRFWLLVSLLAFLTTSVGCNRQDAECLSRIGRKVATHTKHNAGDLGSKVSWPGAKREPPLQEKQGGHFSACHFDDVA